jgi:hypothetical protein
MTEMRSPIPIDIEVKRSNRWVMEFPTEIGIEEWVMQSGSRPSMTQNEVEIPYMNTSTFVAGRFLWEPISLVLLDPIAPSTGQKVMEWIRMASESSTGKMGYASNYKKQLILKMLDPAGLPVEKWTIEGAFITNSTFGDLDMSNDDTAKIQLTIRYDRAIMNY